MARLSSTRLVSTLKGTPLVLLVFAFNIVRTVPDEIPQPNKPVFFIHVSNSAGTAFCFMMKKALAVRVDRTEKNCNSGCMAPFEWQRFCPVGLCKRVECIPPWGGSRSCEAMSEYAARNRLEILGRETVLEEVHASTGFRICSQFRYVMLFKEPLRRLQSNLNRLAHNPEVEVARSLRKNRYSSLRTSDLSGTPSLNNYVTRMILGTDSFFLPPGAINNTHEQAARSMLSKFELVIPVEKLSTDYAQFRLAALFGMQSKEKVLTKIRILLSQRTNHKPQKKKRLSLKAFALLQRMNEIDIRLYNETVAYFNYLQVNRFTEHKAGHAYQN